MQVLHHAAENAAPLLREAARVARRHIVLVEDLRAFSELNPHDADIAVRNRRHDANRVFRAHHEWVHLLDRLPGGWRCTLSAPVVNLRNSHSRGEWSPSYQRVYVATRCSGV